MIRFSGYDSPLLKSLDTKGPGRIQPESLSSVLERVAHSYTKTLPSGCSLNVKAQYSDIDKALEFNRRQEKAVDRFVKSELKKIHTSVFDQETEVEKKPIMRPKFYSKNIDTLPPIMPSHKKANSMRNPGYHRRQATEQSGYPDRFKSLPMHQDPKFAFKRPQILNTETSRSVNHDKINIVSDMCRLFRSGSVAKKHKINGTLAMCKDIDIGMYRWADDVKIANQSTKYPSQMQRTLQLRKDDRRIDNRIYCETKDRARKDMIEITKEVLHHVPTRIWKQNHKTFMVFVDNAIASVAEKKS